MAGATFTLTGNRELDRKFQTLAVRVEKKVLREGLRPAAKLIHAEAVARAPRASGDLAASLKVRAAKRSRKTPGLVAMSVATAAGWFKGPQFYAAFVEFGHKIGSRSLGDTRTQVEGVHFMQQAADARGQEATDLALRLIAEGIEREAKANG